MRRAVTAAHAARDAEAWADAMSEPANWITYPRTPDPRGSRRYEKQVGRRRVSEAELVPLRTSESSGRRPQTARDASRLECRGVVAAHAALEMSVC